MRNRAAELNAQCFYLQIVIVSITARAKFPRSVVTAEPSERRL